MIAAALLLLAAAPADAAPKLGEFRNVGGTNLLPQVGLTLEVPEGPQPGIYRQISLNWHDHELQVGTYPRKAFAAGREGAVGVSLAVEPDGRLSGCSVTRPSGVAEFDAYACRHLLAHAAFHPGLDSAGKRFGGTVPATFHYTLGLSVHMPVPGGDAGVPAKPARPLGTIDLAALGIAKDYRPRPEIGGISATLAVEADGRVSACTVESPTFVDAVDAGACDRLLAARFSPAEDAAGQPVASRYTVSLSFSR